MRLPTFLASLLVGLSVAASAAAGFDNVDLTGATCCSQLSLADTGGKRRTLGDFKGKVVVLAFGFTQCPDVCPTTLQSLAQTVSLLGKSGREVQVLFVTLDPKRDTNEVLSKYVPSFDPSFIALRGTPEQTRQVAREFRVVFEEIKGSTPNTYTIDHTVGVYVLDKEGRARVYARSAEPKVLASDIRRLL